MMDPGPSLCDHHWHAGAGGQPRAGGNFYRHRYAAQRSNVTVTVRLKSNVLACVATLPSRARVPAPRSARRGGAVENKNRHCAMHSLLRIFFCTCLAEFVMSESKDCDPKKDSGCMKFIRPFYPDECWAAFPGGPNCTRFDPVSYAL